MRTIARAHQVAQGSQEGRNREFEEEECIVEEDYCGVSECAWCGGYGIYATAGREQYCFAAVKSKSLLEIDRAVILDVLSKWGDCDVRT
mmetsp:Transcript_42042/g.88313  ORF Transcript_42042/g.88313 Transcript_42042/m.88313 type:complete len:89 (-) Transcript_42042:269-535(-)